jgi:hypothetical protein
VEELVVLLDDELMEVLLLESVEELVEELLLIEMVQSSSGSKLSSSFSGYEVSLVGCSRVGVVCLSSEVVSRGDNLVAGDEVVLVSACVL